MLFHHNDNWLLSFAGDQVLHDLQLREPHHRTPRKPMRQGKEVLSGLAMFFKEKNRCAKAWFVVTVKVVDKIVFYEVTSSRQSKGCCCGLS
jgi:hypothetical protein